MSNLRIQLCDRKILNGLPPAISSQDGEHCTGTHSALEAFFGTADSALRKQAMVKYLVGAYHYGRNKGRMHTLIIPRLPYGVLAGTYHGTGIVAKNFDGQKFTIPISVFTGKCVIRRHGCRNGASSRTFDRQACITVSKAGEGISGTFTSTLPTKVTFRIPGGKRSMNDGRRSVV